MSFDIKKNNPADVAESGYEFAMTLPDGTETDFKIKVRGSFSKKVVDFYRKAYNERRMREDAAKRSRKELPDFTLAESEDFAIRAAVARVITWSGLSEEGVDVPFNAENAERIFREHSFLRELVTKESEEVLNFRHDLDK